MNKPYQHSSFDRRAEMCREMHEYARRVLIDEPENPFETCYGVVYKYTTFRTRIGLGPLSYDPAYEIARLCKETINEARKKLNGARVFDVSVVIQDNPHEFDRVLEIRLKHSEIPQAVLVGVDLSTKEDVTVVAVCERQKPTRILSD